MGPSIIPSQDPWLGISLNPPIAASAFLSFGSGASANACAIAPLVMVRVTLLNDSAHHPQPLRLGLLRGHCQVPDDFDQLAAAEIADLFEGH